jgi:hypothetical protein
MPTPHPLRSMPKTDEAQRTRRRERILFAAVALTAFAFASNGVDARTDPVGDERLYECAGFKRTPPEALERDPVVKTIIDVEQNFFVKHQTLAGFSYIRNEQYRDIRTWTRNGEHYWSGVSIKNPARTMIGKLAWDDSRGIAARRYVEKSYRGKMLESTVISTCVDRDESEAR